MLGKVNTGRFTAIFNTVITGIFPGLDWLLPQRVSLSPPPFGEKRRSSSSFIFVEEKFEFFS